MAIDATRAAFVKSEYRYETAEDTNILNNYPLAREITVETNLSGAGAAALATAYFNQEKTPKLAFKVSVERTWMLEDFVGAPPKFQVSFPQYAADDGREYKSTTVEIDYFTGRSDIVARG